MVKRKTKFSQDDLYAPYLFQEDDDGTLDLLNLNPGDPIVVTTAWPADAKSGEIDVYFDSQQVGTLSVTNPKIFVFDVPISTDKVLPGSYNVTYTVDDGTGPQSSPPTPVTIIDSSSKYFHIGSHQVAFYGQYLPGYIDSWSVGTAYPLKKENILLSTIDTVPNSPLVLHLEHFKKGESTTDLAIILKFDGQNWNVQAPNSLDVARGDSFSLSLVDSQPRFLALNLTA